MPIKFKPLLLPLGLLAAALILFEASELDLWLQDFFYDFARKSWWMDKRATWPRLWFYTGPKIVLIALGVALLTWLLLPARLRRDRFALPWPHRNVWLVALSLAAVPVTVAVMKNRSDIYTPDALERYDGNKPYHHLFEPLPPGWPPNRGHGFPAGHASGGFALMSLAHLFHDQRHRRIGLCVGLVCGWTMGMYQMLKGAHFLSHTVVTMLIAWLLIEVLAMLLKVEPGSNAALNKS